MNSEERMGERMVRVETEVKGVKDNVKKVDGKIDDVLLKLEALDAKFESRFAAKWVEWVIKGLVALILTSVVGSWLVKVIK